jgi:hypothetical protein
MREITRRFDNRMSVLTKLACAQDRRDEVPNKELAQELVQAGDTSGIREIAENLWNKNTDIQSDCIKVLYEIGYLKPELIADYTPDFLKLLKSKENRLLWGAMLALSTVAALKADELFPHIVEIQRTMEKGSVITEDNGVGTLAAIASTKEAYNQVIFPYLLNHLATCRPKSVPQHAEKTLVAVNENNKAVFIQVLEKRLEDLLGGLVTRVRRVIREAEKK